MKNLVREAGDQLAHVAAAVVALAPAALCPHPASFVWAGFCLGMVKELTEEGSTVNLGSFGRVLTSANSMRDVLFWTLGGLGAGLTPLL